MLIYFMSMTRDLSTPTKYTFEESFSAADRGTSFISKKLLTCETSHPSLNISFVLNLVHETRQYNLKLIILQLSL